MVSLSQPPLSPPVDVFQLLFESPFGRLESLGISHRQRRVARCQCGIAVRAAWQISGTMACDRCAGAFPGSSHSDRGGAVRVSAVDTAGVFLFLAWIDCACGAQAV